MKRYFLTIFASLLLGNCTYNVHTVDSDELNQTVALALYPLAQWDKPIDSTRTFIWEGREVTIKGREIQGVHDKDLDSDLLSEETDYADDDFELVTARMRARADRDFAAADKLRDKLLKRGISLEDTSKGVRWHVDQSGRAG